MPEITDVGQVYAAVEHELAAATRALTDTATRIGASADDLRLVLDAAGLTG